MGILDDIKAEVDKITPEEMREHTEEVRRRRLVAEKFKVVRPFTLSVGDPEYAPEWLDLRKKPIVSLQACEFGFAEEIIGVIAYKDESYLVGVGESMRPFILLYEGLDAEQASKIFFLAVLDRAVEV